MKDDLSLTKGVYRAAVKGMPVTDRGCIRRRNLEKEEEKT